MPNAKTHRTKRTLSSSRSSRHRDAVALALTEASGPRSAAEILDVLRETGIGQATVYRLLKEGVETGAFAAVEMPNGPTRYEPKGLPHHHHFECRSCHQVFDVMGCPGHFEGLVPEGFELESHDLTLYGQCEACSS